MFAFPQIAGSRRALGIYDLPDDLPYLDLDDPQRLVDLGVHPSQVVERNRPFTQALALRIHGEGNYKAIRSWSFHRLQWRVYCLWEIQPRIGQIDDLAVGHVAVDSAARTLTKLIV
ncbi:MAG: hypothetical protein NVSMB25_22770 [Thermoleophilaceae bacterium]